MLPFLLLLLSMGDGSISVQCGCVSDISPVTSRRMTSSLPLVAAGALAAEGIRPCLPPPPPPPPPPLWPINEPPPPPPPRPSASDAPTEHCAKLRPGWQGPACRRFHAAAPRPSRRKAGRGPEPSGLKDCRHWQLGQMAACFWAKQRSAAAAVSVQPLRPSLHFQDNLAGAAVSLQPFLLAMLQAGSAAPPACGARLPQTCCSVCMLDAGMAVVRCSRSGAGHVSSRLNVCHLCTVAKMPLSANPCNSRLELDDCRCGQLRPRAPMASLATNRRSRNGMATR